MINKIECVSLSVCLCMSFGKADKVCIPKVKNEEVHGPAVSCLLRLPHTQAIIYQTHTHPKKE